MKSVFLFISFMAALLALEVDVENWKIPNGKTALLEFKVVDGLEYKNVKVGKKTFKIFPKPNDSTKMYVLIPFSYYEKAENKKLYIYYKKNKKEKVESLLLKVVDGKYDKEEIHVSSAKVNPKSKEVKKRIAQEYSEAMKIYKRVTPESYISKPFIQALESKITSDFGKARVYNGSLKGYHSGTDYRAAVGTPVLATNDAKSCSS
ncbi:MAG: hypothetical protein Q9M40_04030 [Sulfurimonas sp.]|nr:hypothetical protein [Sulfurimonas sp.]